jgi:hypothetical protein
MTGVTISLKAGSLWSHLVQSDAVIDISKPVLGIGSSSIGTIVVMQTKVSHVKKRRAAFG